MTHILLRNIVFMMVLIMLGSINFLVIPVETAWWHTAIYAIIVLLSFLEAWWCYSVARKKAKEIDEALSSMHSRMETFTCLLKKILSESRVIEAPIPETPEHDDHEDTGAPV